MSRLFAKAGITLPGNQFPASKGAEASLGGIDETAVFDVEYNYEDDFSASLVGNNDGKESSPTTVITKDSVTAASSVGTSPSGISDASGVKGPAVHSESDAVVKNAKEELDSVKQDVSSLLDQLFGAIKEFQTKSHAVRTSYEEVLKSEQAESARLDEIEPNVVNMSDSFRAATAVALMADRKAQDHQP